MLKHNIVFKTTHTNSLQTHSILKKLFRTNSIHNTHLFFFRVFVVVRSSEDYDVHYIKNEFPDIHVHVINRVSVIEVSVVREMKCGFDENFIFLSM
jgi:hypothetical protein